MILWIKWFLDLPFVKTALMYGAIVLAVVLFLFGIRKGGEKAVLKKVEIENARAVIKAQKKMADVPRPTKRDVSKRLRHGGF